MIQVSSILFSEKCLGQCFYPLIRIFILYFRDPCFFSNLLWPETEKKLETKFNETLKINNLLAQVKKQNSLKSSSSWYSFSKTQSKHFKMTFFFLIQDAISKSFGNLGRSVNLINLTSVPQQKFQTSLNSYTTRI